MEKKYKIVYIDSYEVTTSSGLSKLLHDFVDVLQNVSLDDCMQYFLHLDNLEVGKMYYYRVLSMNKRKRIKFNVCVHSVYVVSNNFCKLDKKKVNVVEFNVFEKKYEYC